MNTKRERDGLIALRQQTKPNAKPDDIQRFKCLGEMNYTELFLFFSSRRRHTSFSRDWSSDVCSSDLISTLKSWPEHVLTMQRNWIGRSEGAEVVFRIEELDIDIPVFTTRPDTLFGSTFFV